MVAIRQTVKVIEEGRVEIRSPELRIGALAEVIVLVPTALVGASPAKLAALDQLQHSMKLDRASADRWADHVAEERRAT